MMRLAKLPILFAFGFFFVSHHLESQTVIFSNAGTSYNNTDAVTTNNYGPVNVANCSSISFSLQYNFSLPFPGGGNMESSDECPFGSGCPGDPNDPSGGGCANCWDFIYVQFQIGGITVHTELVGVPGNTNQSGTLSFGPICTNGATDAGIIVQTQTWAANETITFSNINITCWDASSTLMVNPDPVCSGLPFTLSSTLSNPGSVASTLWTGPGTITTPTNLTTTVTGAPVGTNTYTFTATDDNSCTNSNTIDVTVTQGPTLDDPPNITVCADEPVDVAFTGTGNPTVNWTNSNPAIGLATNGMGDISFTSATVATTTTGTVTITPSENGCTGPSQSFTITVTPGPTIMDEPDLEVCAGTLVSTSFSGTPGATFSWTNDNTAIGLGASGMVVGSASFSFTAANVANQEIANIEVTPSLNGCIGTPIIYTVTVNPAPTVDDPPNQSVCSGEPVDVIFSGTGNPNFNWTNNNPAIGLGANGTGDISFNAATVFAPTTGTITVTPNEAGCPGPAQTFTITVNPLPSVNQPMDVSVCAGATVLSNFTGSAGATFSWTNDNPTIGLAASGMGNLNFVSANVPSQEVASITVTPSIGTCMGNPLNFSITINPAPTVDDPPNQSVCSGEQVDVVFSGTGNPNFNWTNNNPAIGLGANGTGDISFNAANVFAPTTGTITVTPNEGGCPGPAQTFTITVNPLPSVNQPMDVSVCAGATVLTNFTGSAGATFSWTNDNPAIGLAASGMGNLNFVSANVPSQEVASITVTPSIGTCMGNPLNFSITINPAPTVVDPPNQSVCAGEQVDVVFSGTGNPNFNWTNSNPAIGLGANGTGDISFNAATVFAPTTGTITVTPNEAGCPGPAQTFTITVNPLPSVNQPMDVSVCAGATVLSNFTGSGGATFSWTNDNPAIGLASSGNGTLNFVSANVANQEVANITVTPAIGTCLGNPLNFSITINPAPTVVDPPNQTVCAGEQVEILFSGTGNPNFNWTNNNPAIGLGTIGTGDILFDAANVVVPATGTITVTPNEAGCPGPAQQFSITVNPAPGVNQPNDLSVCAGGMVLANFTGTPGATFNWTNDNPAIGLGASGTGNINFTAANVGMPTTGNISVTPSLGGCPGIAQNFSINIDPLPTIAILSVDCASDLLTYDIDFSSSGTTLSSTAGTVSGSGGNFTISGIPAGTNVTITSTISATGCQTQQSVNAPNCNCPPVTAASNPNSPAICEGNPNPALSVSTAPGTTIDWYATPSGGMPLLVGNTSYTPPGILPSGVYSFYAEARDILSDCTSSIRLEVTLTVQALPSVQQPLDQTVCAGEQVTVNFSGTAAASMDWTNSNVNIGLAAAGTGDISFLATNNGSTPLVANLVVTPSLNGCSGAAQNFSITVNPIPSVAMPTDLTTCDGTSVSVNFSATAGATFDWTNSNPAIGLGPSGTGDLNFVAASVMTPTVGNISVTPSLSGCTGPTQNFSITVNPTPNVNIPTSPSVCVGDMAALNFTGSSGATFNWTNSNPGIGLAASGMGDIQFTGINSGTTPLVGNLTVTPSLNSCIGTAQNFSITINPLPSLTVDSTNCSSDLASYSIFVNSSANTLVASAGTVSGVSPNFDITGISIASNVVLTVTNTASGCTQQQTVNAPNCNCAPVSAATNPNQPSICEGAPNPALSVATLPGNTVDWYATPTGGTPLLSGNTSYTPPGALSPGTYSFYAEVREIASNCTSSTRLEVILTVNALPSVSLPADQAVCAGTQVLVNFTGTAGAALDWTNTNSGIGLGASGAGNILFTGINAGNTPLVGNLVVSPSLNGCTGTAQNFSITINPIPSLTVDSTNCSSDLASYSIFVNSSANTLVASAGTVSGASPNFDITGISIASNVVLTVTNTATGCSQQQTVNAPNCNCAPVSAATNPNHRSICEGAPNPALSVATLPGNTVDWYATPTGGTPLLSGNTSYTPPGALSPGTYSFYAEVREIASNCTSSTRLEVILTVNALPSVSLPADQAVCAGTQVLVNFTGTAGAALDWTNTNPGIGLGANGAGNILFTGINAGNTPLVGNLVVTPSLNGCTGTAQNFSITINPIPVAAISGNLNICNGNGTTLTASGGTNISWSSGENTAVIQVNPASTTTYTATVSENGCVATASATVTVHQPTASTLNVITCDPAQVGTTTSVIPNAAGCDSMLTTITTLDNTGCIPAPVLSNGSVSCFGDMDGSLNLSVTNGLAPFQYNWSNGTQTGNGQIPNSSSVIQIQNLAAGSYTVTITGSNGLSSTVSAVISAPAQLSATATAQLVFGQQPLSCQGASDATIQATANGGTPMLQYAWSVAGQNSSVLTGVGAGTYGLTVTDANQCTASSSVTIQDPPALAFEIALDKVACGQNTTTALITPSNGVEPFSVQVNGAAALGGLTPTLPLGNHFIEIQDAHGCTADTMLSVDGTDVPLISLPAELSVAQGETVVLEAQTNLTSWQSLVWTPLPDTTCANCLRQEWIPQYSGQYEVEITDSAGCTASATVRVLVENRVKLYIPNVFTPNGDGSNDVWTVHAGVSDLNLRSLQIFDRWGDMVYALDASLPVNEWPGWDGSYRGDPVNPGVFVYYLEVELVSGEIVLKKGDLTVLR